MFREVLVISYIKIYQLSAVISQRYFGILLECSFGLGSSRNEHKSSSQEITLTKASQTVQAVLLRNTQLSKKTLITAAFSRRFKFVSVRRRFVICDLFCLGEKACTWIRYLFFSKKLSIFSRYILVRFDDIILKIL